MDLFMSDIDILTDFNGCLILFLFDASRSDAMDRNPAERDSHLNIQERKEL